MSKEFSQHIFPGTNIPIYYVYDADDMRQVANDMKMNAVQEKLDRPCEYSSSLEELEKKVKSFDPIKTGLTTAIVYQKHLFSLVLTCEKQKPEEEVWHLSIGETYSSSGLPEKPNDDIVQFILQSFFEEYKEAGPFGVLSTVRHFFASKPLSIQNES